MLSLLLAALAPVAVIAHRGEHLRHAENTPSAIEGAIAAGADYVELDVRTTADGELVVMHDATVDRTTGGSGAVAQLSLAEVRRLGVPTFEDAVRACAGRIRIYADIKQAAAQAVLEVLERYQMSGRTVFYGAPSWLAELRALQSAAAVMPEAVSVERVRELAAGLKPTVFAFDRRDWRPEVIAAAKATGALVFVDRLGADDTPEAWEAAIRAGADGIQTDHPAELAAYLRGRR